MRYLIVGAGLSGAVLARELATRKLAKVTVIDRRAHVAGNCHTERDHETNVMVHAYGPHIFNTDYDRVWRYVQQYCEMMPYTNRVKAVTPRGMYSMPVNLLTINQFFGKSMTPTEAREFIAAVADSGISTPTNFEEKALSLMGRELYENFFFGYTLKQWGRHPRDIPASVLSRLPFRFNFDDSYYQTRYQGIPRDGYSDMVRKILDHPSISVELGHPFNLSDSVGFEHVLYTGAIDEYFGYTYGRLAYRTVTFERVVGDGDLQGGAVVNYTAEAVPWTRIHEHKHFAPWESHRRSVAFREYSRDTKTDDVPYYPVRAERDLEILSKYEAAARELGNVSFVGRLGTYQYLDMDDVIMQALDVADQIVASGSS